MLSPIQTYNNILYKRDDLYKPYDIPISGGKIRQCENLLQPLVDEIRTKYNNTVAICGSVHSTQSVIVSHIANSLGMESIIGIGGKVDFNNHPMLKFCHEKYGTEIKILSGISYNSTLYKNLDDYRKKRNFYIVRYFTNLEKHPDAILGSISNQVENIPNDLDNLVIPTGSGITAAAIILGLNKFNIKPKKVIVVQISGNDRTKDIQRILFRRVGFKSKLLKYQYVAEKTYPYSKFLNVKVADGFSLDPLYESKAHDWLIYRSGIDVKNEKTLFWVVSNSTDIREYSRGFSNA